MVRSVLVGSVLLLVTAPSFPAVAEPVTDLQVEGAVQVRPTEDGAINVDGARAYRGDLQLYADGLLVNEVPMEAYVEGIAEMPARWPLEALKAQAVAARTYAWWHAVRAEDRRSDICPTTACQVYQGIGVVEDGGEAWGEAVDATRGEVLQTDDGAPVLARYHSTSGGRTFDNQDVFPSSGEHAALVGIDDPYDEVSPYHRWTVTFDRELFDELLARGDQLAAVVPVADIERLGDVDDPDATIAVTSDGGDTVEVGAGDLRDFLSSVAPDARPGDYPSRADDGLRRLPTTVPTARYDIGVEDDEVVIEGRGFGHGVGLGQYGARGRAQDGASYTDILSAYYGGSEPTTPEEVPSSIRVDLGTHDQLRLTGDTPMTIEGDGASVERALGTWTATRTDGGWRLEAPEGTEEPLEASDTRTVEGLTGDDTAAVEVEVNKPVELLLDVRAHGTDQEPVLTRAVGVVDAGTHTATWSFADDAGDRVPAGEYAVTLRAEDAAGETAGGPASVTVPAAGDEAATGSAPNDDRRDTTSTTALLVLAAAVLLPVAVLVAWISTRKART